MYISEQKTKYVNIYRIFVNEYIKRIKEKKNSSKVYIFNESKKIYTNWKINKCFQKVLNRNFIYVVYISCTR